MKKTGRPSEYSDQMAGKICDLLASGESLVKICEHEDMPSRTSVFRWLAKDETFRNRYARAREIWADSEFENMMHIADTPMIGVKTKTTEDGIETTEGDMIEHRRLQVDTRKWALARMSPKKYGDSTTLKGDKDAPLYPAMGEILNDIKGRTAGLPNQDSSS